MHAPRSLLSRLRSMPPWRLDALIGALVLLDGVLEVLLLSNLHGFDRVGLGLALAASVATAVALRRRLPVTAVVLSWTSMLGADQVGPDLVENVAGPYFASMLVTFTAGYVLEGRRLWLAAAIGAVLVSLSEAVDGLPDTPGDYLFGVGLGVGGPMLLGQLLRNR